jgi:uncharacterized damage-inducible protein DinB
MREDLLEAWRTNNHINLLLIDTVEDAGMACTLSKRGGRDVSRQFAHMHNVRVWHLQKRAKDLAKGLSVFQTKVSPGKPELRKALSASSKAIETFLTGVLSGETKRRGFKKGIFTTLAYFVAHESHHRGSILLTLKQCGHPLDKDTRDRIWGWDQL